MNIPIGLRIPEWPKWYSTICRKCGECVPRFHDHYCDRQKLPQDIEREEEPRP